MRRRTFVLGLGLAVLPAVACGSTTPTRSTSNTSSTATAVPNVGPTQTRAAELDHVATLEAQVASRSVTPTAGATATTLASSTLAPTRVPPTTTTGPTATAAPAKVSVITQNVSNYRDTIGTLWYIGEAVNMGQADAAKVQVAVSLLGDTGQTVASGSSEFVSPPVLPIIKAGKKAVWRALLKDAPPTWKEERVQVQAGPVDSFSRDFYYYDVRVEGVSLAAPTRTGGWVSASGQVVNFGTATTKYALVVVAAYDASGKLLAVGDGSAKLDEIAPGGSAPFSFDVDQLTSIPASYDTYVFGQRQA